MTGDEVFHPQHGHGTVTSTGTHHVAVRFGSGASHTFPVRPDPGPSHFELMTGEQVVSHLGDGTGERFRLAMAELDRRDREEVAEKVAALRQAPVSRDSAGKGKLYRDLVEAGENPEDAWSHAYSVTSEAMQRQAVIAQLREQGYRGAGFDALTRDAFKAEAHRQAIAAEAATNGYMLNKAGKAAGIDPWTLVTGPEPRARAYASPELRQFWDLNGRPTVKAFQQQLLGHVAGGAPGGDFLR